MIGHGDLIARAIFDDQVVAIALETAQFGRRHVSELDCVDVRRRVVVADDVDPVALGENITVIARPTIERIVAAATNEQVAAQLAAHGIVAGAAKQDVVATIASEGVITRSGIDHIIASATAQIVDAGGAGQCRTRRQYDTRHARQRCRVPYRRIAKLHALDRVINIGRIVAKEEAIDGHAVAGTGDRQHQVVARTGGLDIGRRHTGLEGQRIVLAGRIVGVDQDGVVAVAATEEIGIVACPAVEAIVASTTIENIIGAAAGVNDHVVGGVGKQGVALLIVQCRIGPATIQGRHAAIVCIVVSDHGDLVDAVADRDQAPQSVVGQASEPVA